jgi:hypothetical protein
MTTMGRAFLRHEAAWDLLLLVVISGGVATASQDGGRVLTPRWARIVLGTIIAAIIVGVALALMGAASGAT